MTQSLNDPKAKHSRLFACVRGSLKDQKPARRHMNTPTISSFSRRKRGSPRKPFFGKAISPDLQIPRFSASSAAHLEPAACKHTTPQAATKGRPPAASMVGSRIVQSRSGGFSTAQFAPDAPASPLAGWFSTGPEDRQKRKPLILLRKPGWSLNRKAERQSPAELNHEPPRGTRRAFAWPVSSAIALSFWKPRFR